MMKDTMMDLNKAIALLDEQGLVEQAGMLRQEKWAIEESYLTTHPVASVAWLKQRLIEDETKRTKLKASSRLGFAGALAKRGVEHEIENIKNQLDGRRGYGN